jgi:DNA-binding CsgD family transcriptional regulator
MNYESANYEVSETLARCTKLINDGYARMMKIGTHLRNDFETIPKNGVRTRRTIISRGKKILAMRAKGLKCYEIAEKMDFHPNTISNTQRDYRNILKNKRIKTLK